MGALDDLIKADDDEQSGGGKLSALVAEDNADRIGPGQSMPVQPIQGNVPDHSWLDTLRDANHSLAAGAWRGIGIDPAVGVGYLRGLETRAGRAIGLTDRDPAAARAEAERAVRDRTMLADTRSPVTSAVTSGIGESLPVGAAALASGGAVNPETVGALQGGLSALGHSDPNAPWHERLLAATQGAGSGAVMGAGAGMLGAAARGAGNVVAPAIERAGEAAAGSELPGKIAGWAGGGLAAGTAAKMGLGGMAAFGAGHYGMEFAKDFVGPYAARAVGGAANALGGVVRGAGAAASAPVVAAAGQQLGRAVGGREAVSLEDRQSEALNSMISGAGQGTEKRDQVQQKTTDAGRGNLLGSSAQRLLEQDPNALGQWAPEIAAAVKDGSVNQVVGRLAMDVPDFRAGPLVRLQAMTGGE